MEKRSGFVSLHALIIMVFATLGGAYLLRSATRESGTAGSYFHKRSSAAAAQGGLQAAVAQLESDTSTALALLWGYLEDPSRQWLLGAPSEARARRVVPIPGTRQTYSARILAFDTATGIVKIQSEGGGPGGSVTRITGVYRVGGLDGRGPAAPVAHALFLAGPGRSLGAPMLVEGPAYFGGAIDLAPSASGSVFDGPFKIAAAPEGGTSLLRGAAVFRGPAWFETPLRVQAGGVVFRDRVGFDDDLILDAGAGVQGSGLAGYANGMLSGPQRLDMGGNRFDHSGFVSPTRIANVSSIRNRGEPMDISAALGAPYGSEEEMAVDLSRLPSSKITTATGLGLGDAFTAGDLAEAYHDTKQSKRLGDRDKFQIIVIDKPMTLVRAAAAADNELYKWIIFIVRSTLTVSGNLWKTTAGTYGALKGIEGNVLFYVPDGGSIVGLGGNDRFRGFVHVEAGGSVSYQWGPAGSMVGAVHHVARTAEFALIGPNPFRLKLDAATLDDIATVGGFTDPIASPVAGPALRLVDARIRPRLLGLSY